MTDDQVREIAKQKLASFSLHPRILAIAVETFVMGWKARGAEVSATAPIEAAVQAANAARPSALVGDGDGSAQG